VHVAPRDGISGVALAKICYKLAVTLSEEDSRQSRKDTPRLTPPPREARLGAPEPP
jgi:hypothetical protein